MMPVPAEPAYTALEHTLCLDSAMATQDFGMRLGQCLLRACATLTVLLHGPMGAGKTTLVRGLVQALPGSQGAEVASPSFTLMNLYPTNPQTAHFDLYRLAEQSGAENEYAAPDEAVLEYMDRPDMLVLVEWAQYLDPVYFPREVLHLLWEKKAQKRCVTLKAAGNKATPIVHALQDTSPVTTG